jgi:lipopolysaccharide transport system ATP-binding protein
VAAHLDPDILIVDEVLAVGDLRFQNQCIKQMQKIANSGKTVLFVSHQMTTVENLCKSTFLLNEGEIINHGPSAKVIASYRDREISPHTNSLGERVTREGNGNCKLAGFEIRNAANQKIDSLISGQTAYIILNFEVVRDQKNRMCLSLGISTTNQIRIAHLCMKTFGRSIAPTSDKTFQIRLKLPKVELNQGNYLVTSFLDDESGDIIDWVVDAFTLEVTESDFYGTGMIPRADQAVILMEHSFK